LGSRDILLATKSDEINGDTKMMNSNGNSNSATDEPGSHTRSQLSPSLSSADQSASKLAKRSPLIGSQTDSKISASRSGNDSNDDTEDDTEPHGIAFSMADGVVIAVALANCNQTLFFKSLSPNTSSSLSSVEKVRCSLNHGCYGIWHYQTSIFRSLKSRPNL